LPFDFNEIDLIINARSLALVGASSAPFKFGSLMTMSQLTMGFDGPIYLVNPREKEIMGHEVYPDIRSLPEAPDLVYLTIPAHRSMDVLRECAEVGVRAVVMIAAGFKDIGESGKELEDEALELARTGGFRIIGPNCFGIYNPRNGLTLTPGYDFSKTPGDIAFISQSGSFSVHLTREAQSLGMGFSAVVSYGNASDINESDLLRYFARDPKTSYIAGYLEGVGDGRDFVEALSEATASKPVVLWKVGRAESSRRAVASHTGSLAGSSEIWQAALRQSGAIQASGIDELLDTLVALKKMGLNPGRRVLMSGGGGGLGTYGADVAEENGLELPPLEPSSTAAMTEALGRVGAVVGNPLDLGTPMVPIPEFEAAMRGASANPTTDILIFDLAVNFAYPLVGPNGLERAADILAEFRRDTGKPVAVVLYSRVYDVGNMTFQELLGRIRRKLLDGGVAVFPSMTRAARAIAAINL